MPRRRRIKKARITTISLVPRGANKVKAVFKADGAFELPIRIRKQPSFAEEGLLTALVYVPDMVDSHGDFAEASVVKDMCHNFLSNGGHIDVNHDGDVLSKDKVRICETFLVQKGDPRFEGITDYDGNPIDPTNSWGIVLKLLDPSLRKSYREEGWAGVSMFGMAEVEELSARADTDSTADRIIEALAKKLRGDTEEIDMDEKTLLAALAKNNEALLTGLKDALTKKEEPDKDKDKKEATIKFEGDPTDPEDVKKHLQKVELAKINWDDPKQVSAYLKSIAKDDDADDDADDAEGDDKDKAKNKAKKVSKEDAEEIKKLKARLAKLEGRSNQGDDKGGDDNSPFNAHLEKVKAGRKMADFVNAQRGFAVSKN